MSKTKPCPDCPDGYVWTTNGPTDKECPTCLGLSFVPNEPLPPQPAEAAREWWLSRPKAHPAAPFSVNTSEPKSSDRMPEYEIVHVREVLSTPPAKAGGEVGELRSAIDAMLISHWNLYKSQFGEDSDPNNDIIRKELLAFLSRPQPPASRMTEAEEAALTAGMAYAQNRLGFHPFANAMNNLAAERAAAGGEQEPLVGTEPEAYL